VAEQDGPQTTRDAGSTKDGDEPAPVELGVADDHVAALTKTRKPIAAIEELIWNALAGC